MKKIRTGDNIIVIAGKRKGAKSTVVAFVGEDRVVIKGVNTVKKAVKGQGFIEKDAPIHISNIALYDTKADAPSRVGIIKEKGKTKRIYKKS
jgi:large subunit ribosomal protein L24